jgi:Arc/MetJ-type ribon-helix-helix transcriptional regulator
VAIRRRVVMSLGDEIVDLIKAAIAGGRFGGASHYVRALIVAERRRAGDPRAKKINPVARKGRPRKVA